MKVPARSILTLAITGALHGVSPASAQPAPDGIPAILPLRERAAVMDRWLERRLETLVPALMRREGIDLWIVAAREYNEDPVIETMLPATWMAARRRTVLILHDRGGEGVGDERVGDERASDEGAGDERAGDERAGSGGAPGRVERLAVARYDIGPFPRAWDPESEPDQWARVAELVAERDPERIAVHRSSTFAVADGITATEYEALMTALPERYRDRVVSGERLAIGWLETRIPEEMEVYPQIVRIAHAIIAEGLSDEAIQPGVTTTDDVVWWYRERIAELGLDTWFQPSVSVQRAPLAVQSKLANAREGAGAAVEGREGREDDADRRSEGDFSSRPDESVIRAGDLLHVDFGITYLGLNTDTQQHAYVLRPGEADAPGGLQRALAVGNRLQDLLTDEFVAGRTGNEILAAALARARAEGVEATIYTHPIGYHGHGAGPTIGLWDQQGGVPGRGDYPLFPNTAHSIELNAAVEIAEWGGERIRIMLEEDAFFDGQETRYIDGRQTVLWLIPR